MAAGWGRRVRVDLFQRTVTNQTPTTVPTLWYASLNVGDPLDSGAGTTEVTQTTSGYVRAQITSWGTLTVYTSLTVDTSSVASNGNALSWGPSAGANANWGTITHIGLWSASGTGITEATYFGRALLSPSQGVTVAGITVTCAIGALQMGCITS